MKLAVKVLTLDGGTVAGAYLYRDGREVYSAARAEGADGEPATRRALRAALAGYGVTPDGKGGFVYKSEPVTIDVIDGEGDPS